MTTFTKLKYCVYVLISLSDNDFYVGFTDNLKRRLTEHFGGQPLERTQVAAWQSPTRKGLPGPF